MVYKDGKLYVIEETEREILVSSIKDVWAACDTTSVGGYATVTSTAGTLVIKTYGEKIKLKNISNVEEAAKNIKEYLKINM